MKVYVDKEGLQEYTTKLVEKLKDIRGFVTPQMFGAAADGTTDDKSAFESALNSGKPVYIPSGDYYISSALNNPGQLTIYGDGHRFSKIKLGGSLLANQIASSTIAGIRFYCDDAATGSIGHAEAITVFPAQIASSIIDGCFFWHFDTIFSRVVTVTSIRNNLFQDVRATFCGTVFDSFITNNYINAPMVTNPQTVCFVNVANTTISANFIDYMYKVFATGSGGDMSAITVTGNVFDLCYCIFYERCTGVTFTGNSCYNMTKSANWDVSGNNEMNTTAWCVIKRTATTGAQHFFYSVFSGNSFRYDKLDMYMVSDGYKYSTHDILIDDPVPADKIDFKMELSNNTRDGENIMIRPMLKRTVDRLPSASLSGSTIVSFNHDEVIYNGTWYININGTWNAITTTTP